MFHVKRRHGQRRPPPPPASQRRSTRRGVAPPSGGRRCQQEELSWAVQLPWSQGSGSATEAACGARWARLFHVKQRWKTWGGRRDPLAVPAPPYSTQRPAAAAIRGPTRPYVRQVVA